MGINRDHHILKDLIYQGDAKILPSDISPDEKESLNTKSKSWQIHCYRRGFQKTSL